MNKKYPYLIISIVIFIIFSYLYLFLPSKLNVFDNKLRDEMFLIRGEINTTNQIVIVDIDEKSLLSLGQWPWSRDKISTILQNLTNSNALIIGLDIFFAEQDTKSPIYLAKKFHLNLTQDYDKMLAQTLQTTPTITGYLFDFETNNTKNVLPNIPAIFIQKNLSTEYLLQAKGYISNIPILQNNAYSGGFVNMIPDVDGVIRSVPLLIKYDDIVYPSLAFEMFRIATGVNKVIINYSDAGVENIQLQNYKIKTDRFGRLFINYRGGKRRFKYISAIDIYNNNFDKKDIQDKFVLIGTSANGIFDLRVTPFENVFAGVEIHANIIDNLLKGDFLYKLDIAEILDIAILFIVLIITFLLSYYFNAIISSILIFAFMMLYLYIVYYVMFSFGYVISIFLPIMEIITLWIIFNTINYFLENQKTKALKNAFSKKVSSNVMNELLNNSNGDILAPKDKELTVFFSDIRSFTTISETINNPTKVINLLNFYMTPMVENITLHKGTIDKFIGDAIMAYWNAPIDIKNHCDEAVSSAIEQIKLLKKLQPTIKEKFNIDLNIGIGINTGVATIGEMGSKGRADYTVIGDTVNLASRLEGLNKVYHSNILISEFTYHKLTKDYIIREIDLVKVKGKTEAIRIYQVIDFGKKDFTNHDKALQEYRKGNFENAITLFSNLLKENNDELYSMFIERCKYLLENKITNFDGVWKFTTK